MRIVSSSLCGLAVLGFGLSPGAVVAAAPTAAATAQVGQAPTTVPAGAARPVGPVEGFGRRVDAATLARLSGGSDVSQQMTLNGTVTGNQSDNVITGSNSISAGSFNGATGLPMVIQNTGSGVLIQNATILNVQFQP